MFEFLSSVLHLGKDKGSPGRKSLRLSEGGVRLGKGVHLGEGVFA